MSMADVTTERGKGWSEFRSNGQGGDSCFSAGELPYLIQAPPQRWLLMILAREPLRENTPPLCPAMELHLEASEYWEPAGDSSHVAAVEENPNRPAPTALAIDVRTV